MCIRDSLPTEWLGEHSAEMVTDAVNTLLDEVTHDLSLIHI